ncbi:unnamed protein product [Linum tenue]|uniref:Uncharacterized protein n=1 Tax=Linum tenue TaxID=586396 RepID=A0AAV0GTQ9_9ROSI|nr:unnamed protein product [Linum tenue]
MEEGERCARRRQRIWIEEGIWKVTTAKLAAPGSPKPPRFVAMSRRRGRVLTKLLSERKKVWLLEGPK